MPKVGKPQMDFLSELFNIMFVITGKYNFSNLSRYSSYCERTFRRWYSSAFNFVLFNYLLISELPKGKLIAAIDASFLQKSGKKTYGKGKFWSTIQNRVVQGLEISSIAIIHLGLKQAFHLSVKQTNGKNNDDASRVDQYVKQFESVISYLRKLHIKYLVADGFYAKQKFVNSVVKNDIQIISHLRYDANLRWLYHGPHKKRRGPKQKYAGKVQLTKKNHFNFVMEYEGFFISEAIVYSISLKRKIKVVMLQSMKKPTQYALLFTTELKLPALFVVEYYDTRFQIEFLFRDAKQHTGLSDCQSTKKKSLDFHFNTSFAALNVAKIEILKQNNFNPDTIISVDNYKRRKSNEHWLSKIIYTLDLNPDMIKFHPNFKELLFYGLLAA